MEAHIVTIPGKNFHVIGSDAAISWHDLHAAKFTFDKPFRMKMDDGQVILAHKVLRVMPKRRMVVFGSWSGRPVVAKLFYDPQHARRHMEKDMAGINLLCVNKIPAPAILYSGVSEDRRVYVLVYQRISEGVSLEEIWQSRPSTDAVLPLLQSALIELATQHVMGVRQRDLHLKNFLLLGEIIYTLDGGQIQSHDGILPKEQSIDSLALFLAQLGAGHEKYQEQLYAFYAQSRGWVLKSEDLNHLFELIREYNVKRWQQFRRKIFRESTHFAHIRNKDCYGMIDRCFNGIEFLSFLKNPDAIFNRPNATILKDGNSATVIKVRLDSRDLVIKRYNIKNIWHQLRRSVRSTRAAKSWELAHKLNMFGVPTAKPAAFIEKKLLGMRSQSYFVSEYVSSEHIGEYFNSNRKDEMKSAVMMEKTANLLKLLQKMQITHGDLKMTNILVNANEEPVLIDLDGASEYFSMTALRRAWQCETERLLRNFEDKPDLQEKFRSVLVEQSM